MSGSTKLMPFFCKWLGAHSTHSDLQYFETKEKLRDHIIQHDINTCKISTPGDSIYICPWKGCNKNHSDTLVARRRTFQKNKLKEHLHRHIQQQQPFKCPICNHSRFDSPDALNQHLIIRHNGSVVDPNTDDDDISSDENEELNLGKAEYENNLHVKKEAGKDEKDEIIPTTKLSYRDALVKGKAEVKNDHVKKEADKYEKDEIITMNNNTTILSYSDFLGKESVNENKNTGDFLSNYDREQAAWDLVWKGIEAISLLPEREVEYYDLDNENYDDWPDAPQEVLTEAEQDELMWKAFRNAYKGSKAVEYFDKAFELLDGRS